MFAWNITDLLPSEETCQTMDQGHPTTEQDGTNQRSEVSASLKKHTRRITDSVLRRITDSVLPHLIHTFSFTTTDKTANSVFFSNYLLRLE